MSNRPYSDAHSKNSPYKEEIMGRIAKWIEEITTPEFREYKRQQLSQILSFDFGYRPPPTAIGDGFDFTDPIDKQHRLVMSFLFLNQATEVLSQCQYYFRRYPFAKLPIPREDHARNMCEFYFSQFYIIECRIKEVTKNLKDFVPDNINDPGKIVKLFHKEFIQELKTRGTAIHSQPFDHVDFDRLFVKRLMSTSRDSRGWGWDMEHRRHYRKFASTWSERARRRSADAALYVNAVAALLLKHATFLSE